MSTAIKKCKVCGVEYPYCKTVVKDGTFRYQDVACCPEHGSIYLAQIMESRGIKTKTDVKENDTVKDKSTVSVKDFESPIEPSIEKTDKEKDSFTTKTIRTKKKRNRK